MGRGLRPVRAESPIFIVAFPRSGTTLMELTLDAHPDLVSMDEQALVQASLDDLLATGIRYPEQLGKVSESAARATCAPATGSAREPR